MSLDLLDLPSQNPSPLRYSSMVDDDDDDIESFSGRDPLPTDAPRKPPRHPSSPIVPPIPLHELPTQDPDDPSSSASGYETPPRPRLIPVRTVRVYADAKLCGGKEEDSKVVASPPCPPRPGASISVSSSPPSSSAPPPPPPSSKRKTPDRDDDDVFAFEGIPETQAPQAEERHSKSRKTSASADATLRLAAEKKKAEDEKHLLVLFDLVRNDQALRQDLRLKAVESHARECKARSTHAEHVYLQTCCFIYPDQRKCGDISSSGDVSFIYKESPYALRFCTLHNHSSSLAPDALSRHIYRLREHMQPNSSSDCDIDVNTRHGDLLLKHIRDKADKLQKLVTRFEDDRYGLELLSEWVDRCIPFNNC